MEFPSVGVAFKRRGDVMELQPFQPTDENVETLTVDLRNSSIDMKPQPRFVRNCTVVPGVLGVMTLTKRSVLITIKEAKQVATLHGYPVYQVLKTELHLPQGALCPEDEKCEFGRGLYFSYKSHLTLTTERQTAVVAADAAWELEDERFFWNQYLMEPVTEMKAHAFVLPVMQGFVHELVDLDFSKSGEQVTGTLTVIARRSVKRLGTRNWRRGADEQGSVANYVETEQHLRLSTGHQSSFVQLRGSIPVFWTSIPNVNYKAPTRVGREVDYTHAFDAHVNELLRTYNVIASEECVAVNLAHATGSEGSLTRAFDSATRRYSRTKSGFRLVNFDFHKECGTTRYHRLSVLFGQIKDDVDRFGQFVIDKDKVTSVQDGVVRVNCVDCLDRTNVVQTVFGRYALESFLKSIQILDVQESLPAAFPSIEAKFKVVWADHGDEVSLQYSGTGALKSGFTRTGKRSPGGLIDDGIKSITRYYLNNFEDGRKQDALDLVSGAFVIGRDTVSADFQRSPDLLIYTVLGLFFYGLVKLCEVLFGMMLGGDQLLSSFYRAILSLLVAAFIARFVMIQNGSLLVCKPKLRPDLPKQW